MIRRKHIVAIDFVVILASLFVLVGVVGYAKPLVISPLDDLVTSNGSVLFSFENGNLILIDDNLDFSSPTRINVEDNILINLKPGIYYWKVEGVLSSEIRRLTINSEVDLRIRLSDESYEVVNGGNVVLDVEYYEEGRFVGKETLDVDESGFLEGDKFVGGEK